MQTKFREKIGVVLGILQLFVWGSAGWQWFSACIHTRIVRLVSLSLSLSLEGVGSNVVQKHGGGIRLFLGNLAGFFPLV